VRWQILPNSDLPIKQTQCSRLFINFRVRLSESVTIIASHFERPFGRSALYAAGQTPKDSRDSEYESVKLDSLDLLPAVSELAVLNMPLTSGDRFASIA